MPHTFIINTENVNEYGYRVLTDGIDYTQYLRNPVVLFMHDRYNHENRGSEVIGKVTKLYKQNNQLLADIEFDENDPFAKKIADKVAGDFIRMASMSADVKATSSDPELVLAGQSLETVTKCKLVEISIVDIGGNDDALKLSKDGKPVTLKKLINKNEPMSKMTTLALMLSLAAETPEDVVLGEVKKLQLAKETAENEAQLLKTKLADICKQEATALVEKAISLSLIPEDLKAMQLKSFETDHEGMKVVLTKLIADAEVANTQNQTQAKIKEVVLGAPNRTPNQTLEESYDYLQKHDPVKLAKIKNENPQQYAALAKDYAKGVRYVSNK